DIRLRASGAIAGEWDADRLAQVLTNLFTNALQYSPAGTPVTVTLDDDEREARVAVHNEGDPIPEEVRRSLFEPFRRGTRGQGNGNVGLGLSVAHRIVEAHGGRIEVRSDEENGT